MSQSAALLRLLEPAVRPVSAPAGVPRVADPAGQAPFERQGFDALLTQARQTLPAAGPETAAVESPDPTALSDTQPPGPLDALADITHIENPTLRAYLAANKPA